MKIRLLGCLWLALFAMSARADEPGNPSESDYLYRFAVMEYFVNRDRPIPWGRLGKVQKLIESIHQKGDDGTIDTTLVRGLDLQKLVAFLSQGAKPTLVANVAAKAGDAPRTSCGLQTNLEFDFSDAATKSGAVSTIEVRLYQSANFETAKVGDSLFANVEKPVKILKTSFMTTEGDTLAVLVTRGKSGAPRQACLTLITP